MFRARGRRHSERLRAGGLLLVLVGATVLSGCRGWQSALDPQTPQAQSLADLFWAFTAIAGVIWLSTLAVLALSLLRRRQEDATASTMDAVAERRVAHTVEYATAASISILIVLAALSYAAQKHLFVEGAAMRTVTITGRQWWWDIRYEEAGRDASIVTANELHLPVGEPIRVNLSSADVIHSFWMPNLFGKRDLVPGMENAIVFTPMHTGTWRGQCAEFCGLQHARMALFATVASKADFERWRSEQGAPAMTPTSSDAQAGQAAFFSHSCDVCHTVRGTPAAGEVGPDLTHLASRQWIAAGAQARSADALRQWIADPHAVKPGVHMPATRFEAGELEHLVAFLEGLK